MQITIHSAANSLGSELKENVHHHWYIFEFLYIETQLLNLYYFLECTPNMHLKVVKVAPDPPTVLDHQVPIFTVDDQLFKRELWDLTTQQVYRRRTYLICILYVWLPGSAFN